MTILTVRTDRPEAEVGLYDDSRRLAYHQWPAHRQLAESLHHKIKQLLVANHLDWQNIAGVVVYQGPGSFTGLRIGLSVANALAYSLDCAIVGASGEDWLAQGIDLILKGCNQLQVMAEYGAPVHLTLPKK